MKAEHLSQNLTQNELIVECQQLWSHRLGYSVSLFTSWRAPVFESVWVKERRSGGAGGDDRGAAESPPCPSLLTVPAASGGLGYRSLGAARVPGEHPIHPIPHLSADGVTTPASRFVPAFEALPHFMASATPSVGDELQTEYFVDRPQLREAFAALAELMASSPISDLVQITEVRFVARDGFLMSPCGGGNGSGSGGGGGDNGSNGGGSFETELGCAAFHFTWLNRESDVVDIALPLIEAVLRPFGARPHFGKVHGFTSGMVAQLYGDRLAAFRGLAQRLDPTGKFVNDLLRELLGLGGGGTGAARRPSSPAPVAFGVDIDLDVGTTGLLIRAGESTESAVREFCDEHQCAAHEVLPFVESTLGEFAKKHFLNPVLDSIFTTRSVRDAAGVERTLSSSLHPSAGRMLYDAVVGSPKQGALRTLEVGLAFGISALYACQAHKDRRAEGAIHVAIDPFQSTQWGSAGVLNLQRAGLWDGLAELREAPSYLALPQAVADGERFDIVHARRLANHTPFAPIKKEEVTLRWRKAIDFDLESDAAATSVTRIKTYVLPPQTDRRLAHV